MKKIKFKTSKGEFVLMDGAEQIDQTLRALLDEYSPVSKVSEMTEEQFAEVVESHDWHFNDGSTSYMFRDYRVKSEFDEPSRLPFASKSFASLVCALGWYFWENPVQHSIASLSDQEQAYRQLDADWQEAESKTFYSPILLKKI